MRSRLLLGFLLMGFTLTIAQTLMVRELLVSFSGTEIVIGLVLGNWLLLEAMGSGWLARLRRHLPLAPPVFALLQLLLAMSLVLSLILAASVRRLLGAVPGQSLDLGATLIGSLIVCAWPGVLDGLMFAWGVGIYARWERREERTAGHVYAAEATGALLGGSLLTYLLLPRLPSVTIVFLLMLANGLSACTLLVSPTFSWRRLLLLGCALCTALLGFVGAITPLSGHFRSLLLRARYGGQPVLESADSVYSNVTVIQRGEQYIFYVDGVPLVTVPTPDVEKAEALVHLSLLFHPRPQRALVLSGGVGGILYELEKYKSLARIDYAELDPLLIRMVQRYPTPLTSAELSDPRLRIYAVDGQRYVREAAREGEALYDLVLLNLPYPYTLLINRYYTREFYAALRSILSDEGILAFTFPGSAAYLGHELRDLSALMLATLAESFPHILIVGGEEALWLASPSSALEATDLPALQARWLEAGIHSETITPAYLAYRLDPSRLAWLRSTLEESGKQHANSDGHPSGLYYALRYWNALLSPSWSQVLFLGGHFRRWPLILFLVASAVCLAAWRGKRKHRLSVIWAVVTTGFAGMSFDLAFILTLQTLQGYMYQRVGLLVGAFMAGLALGSLGMTFLLQRRKPTSRWLLVVESSLLAYCALVALLLPLLFRAHIGDPVTWLLLALNVIAGIFVGSEFPLASRMLSLQGQALEDAAGSLYAFDLVGAFIASLWVPVILVPILGMAGVFWLLVALKAESLALVATLRER